VTAKALWGNFIVLGNLLGGVELTVIASVWCERLAARLL
jgi:hypothetical protein